MIIVVVSAVVLVLILVSSLYVIHLNGKYSKSELVSERDNVLCYEMVSCRCLGSLAIADTTPVLGYHCNGFEFCSNEVSQECFDMNNYYGD